MDSVEVQPLEETLEDKVSTNQQIIWSAKKNQENVDKKIKGLFNKMDGLFSDSDKNNLEEFSDFNS